MVVGCSGDDSVSSTGATDSSSSSTSDSDSSGTETSGTDPTTSTSTPTSTSTSTSTSSTTAAETDPTTGTSTTSTTGTTGTTDGATCDDGAQNGDESDIDCGGSCLACADGQLCNDNPDCSSGNCDAGTCAPPDPCTNGVLDEGETDIDCGGTCGPCDVGQMCLVNEDCLGDCVDGLCEPPECLEDIDCEPQNNECAIYTCVDYACVGEAMNEGGDCVAGLCSTQDICTDGVCGGGMQTDCSNLDSGCNIGVCNPEDGMCITEMAANDTPCQALGCGDTALCTDGVCIDDAGDALFYEPFVDNSQAWELDTEWAIGAAVAGCGDPEFDHSPTDDNGVAGVVLGGCATTSLHDYYCLTSAPIDTTGLNDVWMSFWRDLYSDYTPYMKNKIEVWDGQTWVIIFETFGFPGADDSDWIFLEYDLNAYSNAALQLRWCNNIGNGGAYNRGSWNVDDVVVGPMSCQPF